MARAPHDTTHAATRPLKVQALSEGDTADGIVVVRKKVRRQQPNGEVFLLFQLGDGSGQINAILWRGGDDVDRQLEPGDLAHVRGSVEMYQKARQIRIQSIHPAAAVDLDAATFLPRSPHDGQAQYERLLAILDSVEDAHLHALYAALFRDEDIAARFRTAPAGKGWHHAYVGGLLDHCLSMIELGEVMVRQHDGLDRDLLLGGIVLHDIGKIEELTFRGTIDYTTSGKLVGHLVQGCLLVARCMDRIDDFPDELRQRVLHMLVSHHGALERGSPRQPMTLEATVVHLLDHLDSQAEATARLVGDIRSDDGWSEHVRLINRSLYRGTKRSR